MMIAKNEEEKRNRVWRIVTMTASAVIIVVVIYFLYHMFAGNPLEGTWTGEDNHMQLTIRRGTTAVAGWSEISETPNVRVKLDYVLDKENKTITFKVNDEELKKMAESSETGLTEEALQAEVSILETTFDYSLDSDKLTLAEREYGEKIIFVKK